VPAVNATVTVYWSEVATLVTPDTWHLIGSTVIPNVPVGNVLTVSNEIVWASGDIPATGHYCFVATVGTADDPVPPLANLVDFDNFMAFIRDNNNVTWRNFNVVAMGPSADPIAMPFQIAGALDRAMPMGLEVIARLPEGAKLMLEGPAHLLERLGFKRPQFRVEGRDARVALKPQGNQKLGVFDFPVKYRAKLRLLVQMPKEAKQRSGWQVAVRQYLPKDNMEVGRVTWYLAAPEFFKRRKRNEECMFGR
jgi:hypothetical protein